MIRSKKRRQDQYFEVKIQGPVFDIIDIVIDLFAHPVEDFGLSSETIDLCTARHPELDPVTAHIYFK